MRIKLALALVVSAAVAIGGAGSANALACSRWPFRVGANPTTYYFYGNDSIGGGLATATSTVGSSVCLFDVRSVSTVIELPNGSRASRSSWLGQCSAGISIASGSYSAFQIKSTHTLNLWNGESWSYVD